MRLSAFIKEALEPILHEWDEFARSIQPPHRAMELAELRDHAEEMLLEIAGDLDLPQTEIEKLERSKGRGPARNGDSAAEIHATHRLLSGFTIDQLVAEYRALRTSVLHLWAVRHPGASAGEVEDIMRFNEAVDQALSESVARYSSMVRQAQDIFIGILGHDIRTPLNAISIGAETLMCAETMDPRHIQLASRIFNSSARISSLVNDLLDFTQARFGLQLTRRPANLGRLAQQVTEEILAAYPERNIQLMASDDLDGIWDSGRIGQVLSNLVSNALQHGDAGQPISIRLAGDADCVTIAVQNTGTPIPEDEIGHIFEPLRRYLRTPSYDRASNHNLGLGLYIAREVVTAHGGTIIVMSNAAAGTCFTVRLPRKP
jgi:signal transduction histidine kinase